MKVHSHNTKRVLTFLLDKIFIRVGTKLYIQVVGIPMGTNCAPWLPIYSCSVMRGTLCCRFLMINRLILLTLLAL